jgi:ATP-dependent Clp protease ATP-binding subunit ClpX
VKQYESLFEMEECSLKFTDDALEAIAAKAVKRGTGARGLRSIIEEAMLDIMYELPDQPKGTSFEVNRDIIEGRKKLFDYTPPTAKSA